MNNPKSLFGPSPPKRPSPPPNLNIGLPPSKQARFAQNLLIAFGGLLAGVAIIVIPQYLSSLKPIKTPEQLDREAGANYLMRLPKDYMYGFYQNKWVPPRFFYIRTLARHENQFKFLWKSSPKENGSGVGKGVGVIHGNRDVELTIDETKKPVSKNPMQGFYSLSGKEQEAAPEKILLRGKIKFDDSHPYLTGVYVQRGDKFYVEAKWLLQSNPPLKWQQPSD